MGPRTPEPCLHSCTLLFPSWLILHQVTHSASCFLLAGVDGHCHWQWNPPTQPVDAEGCRLLRQTGSLLSPVDLEPVELASSRTDQWLWSRAGTNLCLVVSLSLVTISLSFLIWKGDMKMAHLTKMLKELKTRQVPL